ncbi:hypothetical protein [Helicobacter sp.]|uniref:hypothetical protein n=1 Tax=Helicobacter sp. TaxID=218 RepID=UPI0025BCA1FB|nr:hypothetical protein [Helicobacter sp.]MCI5967938.1 hypothetical protein [Helicobacter sp.]MDY2585300.1 hypothetical protein [Helicobacter sp.]
MYKNLSLKAKIITLVFGVLAGLIIAGGIIMYYENSIVAYTRVAIHNNINEETQQKLKLATDSLANAFWELVRGLYEATQIQIIATGIEKFRFEDDKSGYYFAYKEHIP